MGGKGKPKRDDLVAVGVEFGLPRHRALVIAGGIALACRGLLERNGLELPSA